MGKLNKNITYENITFINLDNIWSKDRKWVAFPNICDGLVSKGVFVRKDSFSIEETSDFYILKLKKEE